jgi:uncharacterized phiE125 gp8 family phage protein
MIVRHKVITPAVIYPILATDEVLKRHCNLSTTDTDEDDLLTEYIKSAVEDIERYIGYPLMTQVIECSIPDTIDKLQRLTGNVNDIVSYTYYNGTEDVTVSDASATGLEVSKWPILSYVKNDTWPTGTNYRIKCNAGYAVADVPSDIKQACMMLVMAKYEHREGDVGMPETVMNILDYHFLP